MNSYNRTVIDQYCREVGYSASRKQQLIDELTAKYGDRMNSEDLFHINTEHAIVDGTMTSSDNATTT
jgi:hypothetical protein